MDSAAERGGEVGDPAREAHLGSVLRCALAATSLGAGLIHVTAVFDHTEHPVVATFFVLLAAVQVGWAGAVVHRPTPTLLKAGAALSAAVVVIWVLSRTTGLAGVPGAEDVEAVGLKDSVASALEVLLVVGVVARFAAFGAGLRVASGRLASGLAISAVGVLTATALIAPARGHHHGGADDHHSGSEAAATAHHHDDGSDAHGPEAAADHPHEGDNERAAGANDHQTGPVHVHGDGHHDELAIAGHDHTDAGAAHVHADGHDHSSPSLASAAGEADAAGHDHNAPGHVHDPSHHHHHGPSPGTTEGHDGAAAHEHDAAHDHAHDEGAAGSEPTHDHSTAPDGDNAGHEHGSGDHHHDGGHDHHKHCGSPAPENKTVTTVQEIADFYLGVGCLETTQRFVWTQRFIS